MRAELEDIYYKASLFRHKLENLFSKLEEDGWYLGGKDVWELIEHSNTLTKRNFFVDEEFYDILNDYGLHYETITTKDKVYIIYLRDCHVIYQHAFPTSNKVGKTEIEILRSLLYILLGHTELAVEDKSVDFLNTLYKTLAAILKYY